MKKLESQIIVSMIMPTRSSKRIFNKVRYTGFIFVVYLRSEYLSKNGILCFKKKHFYQKNKNFSKTILKYNYKQF